MGNLLFSTGAALALVPYGDFFATGNGTVAGFTLNSSSWSDITSATGGRTLQLGAKYNF